MQALIFSVVCHGPKGDGETVFVSLHYNHLITVCLCLLGGARHSPRSTSPLLQGTACMIQKQCISGHKGDCEIPVSCLPNSTLTPLHIFPPKLKSNFVSISGNHSSLESWPQPQGMNVDQSKSMVTLLPLLVAGFRKGHSMPF